jgi:CheY-like chemotaxis protein
MIDDDIDDHEIFCEALSELSLKVPIEIKCLSSASEGLHYLEKNPSAAEVIFLDLNMPGMTGLELLKKLKGEDPINDIPVVMYSTSRSQMDIDACLKAGASYYIVKPSRMSELVETLRSFFQSSGF